jgi:exonuclease III
MLTHMIKDIDIALLQETHFTKTSLKKWRTARFRSVHAAFGPSNARGAAIVARKQNDMESGSIWEDRIVAGTLETAVGRTNIVNIYAPNVTAAKRSHEEYLQFMSGLDNILAN